MFPDTSTKDLVQAILTSGSFEEATTILLEPTCTIGMECENSYEYFRSINYLCHFSHLSCILFNKHEYLQN